MCLWALSSLTHMIMPYKNIVLPVKLVAWNLQMVSAVISLDYYQSVRFQITLHSFARSIILVVVSDISSFITTSLWCTYMVYIFFFFSQIANHPLLIRRVYGDEDVVRIGRMLYPKGVFGFQCTLERAIEEIKSYNDFAIHRVFTVILYYSCSFY